MKSIRQPDLYMQKRKCKGDVFNRAEQDLSQSHNNEYSTADLCVAVHVEMRQGCTSQLCTTLARLAVVLSCWAIRQN